MTCIKLNVQWKPSFCDDSGRDLGCGGQMIQIQDEVSQNHEGNIDLHSRFPSHHSWSIVSHNFCSQTTMELKCDIADKDQAQLIKHSER